MVGSMLRGYAGKIWLITGLGLVARLALLAYQPLWRDEAFTALAVQRPLGSMIDGGRNERAPPLVLAPTTCLLRPLDRPSPLRWALYLAMSILAVYTVYFALFAVFAQVVAVALLHGRQRRGTMVVVGALAAGTLASLISLGVAARAQLDP